MDLPSDAPPRMFGAYVVVRDSLANPEFLPRSVGGHWKGLDRTETPEALRLRWVEGTTVIYIGAAGIEAHNKSHLRGRLSALRRYGKGEAVPHAGGCRMWQLSDHSDLLVGWLATPGVPGTRLESQLLNLFHEKWNSLPFANGRF